ncbi:receptor-type tyrosine-protein phosphatase H-like [Ruditapes philippinarum]|uniref:receptor-type tyrosine-protein phosphatase H-like n=1 Tax=Ruditapes philippinarum TaxID=129788 RepID=UPI00295AB05E|nr:receptor-type tyrosine-protein phosphatase H-like [Ruditapes philippinarum]
MTIYKISLSRTFCCFKSSAPERYVITRKKGMLNDQEYNANATSIFVRWTKPDCISNLPLKYQVTSNKIQQKETDEIKHTLVNLIPTETYEIEVFTIYNGKSCLLLAEEITAAPIKLCLKDVCYVPDNATINSKITWTVKYHDSPDFISGSDKVGVICRWKETQVHRGKVAITDSRYTIPGLYLDRTYTVYVYVIYMSVNVEPPVKIKLKPYKPTNLKYTEKSTEIDVEWTRPDYTGSQQLQYLVTCDGDDVGEPSSTTACMKTGLVPGKTYEIKIYTLINLMKSQPLVEKITTSPHKPTNLTFTATSTQIELKWEKPEDASNQKLEYEVTCNQVQVKTTSNTSCKVENLNSRQQYDIEIFTVINGKKSLPLKQNIRTQPSPPIASHSNITGQQTVLPEIPLHNVNLVSQKRV